MTEKKIFFIIFVVIFFPAQNLSQISVTDKIALELAKEIIHGFVLGIS